MALSIGDKVFIRVSQPFLKTNDNMPMLRPPDLVASDELGQIVALRAMDIVEVKFRRGTFLLPVSHLMPENQLSQD